MRFAFTTTRLPPVLVALVLCLLGVLAAPGPEMPAAPQPAAEPQQAGTGREDSPGVAVPGGKADLASLWSDTAALLAPTAKGSRRLLLGNRDPNGPTCAPRNGNSSLTSVPDGGVGTRLVHLGLATSGQRTGPEAEYQWQQTALKAYLTALEKRNHPVYAKALRLADQAEAVAAALDGLSAWPRPLQPAGLTEGDSLLGRSAFMLDRAMVDRNLEAARRWAAEFRAATFALADLHRWVEFLLRNEASALSFQSRCRELYYHVKRPLKGEGRVAKIGLDSYPGAHMFVLTVYNLIEVEHQAEGLFGRPPKAWTASSPPPASPADPAADWMPPHLRGTFLDLRAHLPPQTRGLLDEAARSPYDRSYLANMLFRFQKAGVVKQAGVVLERFAAAYETPTREGLLDVLFYRGGSPDGGTRWGDRFHPRLMAAAGLLSGSDEQVLLGAQHFTRGQFRSYAYANSYASATLTRVLESGKMDCLAATDMIGCLYRNAGRAGFYNLRGCAGVAGHSVAAAAVRDNGKPSIGIVDGLGKPQTRVRLWPESYPGPHEWPDAYPGPRAPMYAAELFTRGLDNYLWAEGFIARGRQAGTLVQESIPYLSTSNLAARSRQMQLRRQAAAPKG